MPDLGSVAKEVAVLHKASLRNRLNLSNKARESREGEMSAKEAWVGY